MPNLNYLKYFSGNEVPETIDPLDVKRRKITLPDSVLTGLGVPTDQVEKPSGVARGGMQGKVTASGDDISISPNPLFSPDNLMSPEGQPPQQSDTRPDLKLEGDNTMVNIQQQDVQLAGRDPELNTPLKIEQVRGDLIPNVDKNQELKTDPKKLKEEPSNLQSFLDAIAKSAGQSTVDLVKGLNASMDIAFNTALDTFDPENEYQLGQLSSALNKKLEPFEKILEEYLPTQDDSFWTNSLPSGIGSGLFFIAGGLGGRGLGMSAKLTSSLLGAGTQSGNMFNDAIQSGASEKDALINFFAGTAIGSSEGLMGIGSILDNVGKRVGQSFIRRFFTGAIEETFQETMQQLSTNLTVQETYDMSRNLMDGVVESGAVAFLTGGLFDASASAINRLQKQDLSEQDQILLQQAEVNLNTVKEMYKANMKGDVESLNKLGMGRMFDLAHLKTPNARKFGNTIDKIVKEHNKNGGSSFTSRGKLTKGYAVATQSGNGKEIDGAKITPKDIVTFIEENEKALADPNNFVGTWFNKETGKTVLDVSTVVATEEEAQKMGRKFKQDAVFDLKNLKEIPVLPANVRRVRDEQNNIPMRYSLPVFHFSDVEARGMVTDPKLAGKNSYTGRDMQISKTKRSWFYTDPNMVKDDHPSIRSKKMFLGNVDIRTIYDITRNEQKYGIDENGVFNVGEAIDQAKADGWSGVRYKLTKGEVVNVFDPVYVERLDGTPSIGERITGSWDQSVQEAKARLNKGMYGANQMMSGVDVVAGMRFVSDIGMIMADKLIKTKTAFGTPQEFIKRLIDEFGETYPVAIRRHAREIYEYAKSIREDVKKSPLSDDDIKSIQEASIQKLQKGGDDVYIPTGKGAIIIGGDILGQVSGRPKEMGIGFPKEQALKASLPNGIKLNQRSGYFNLELPDNKGSITGEEHSTYKMDDKTGESVEEVYYQVRGSGISNDLKGQGYGAKLYDSMIDYAIENGVKMIKSDNSLSQDSYKQYLRLKDKGLKVTLNPNVQSSTHNGRTYYRTKGNEAVFTVEVPSKKLPRRGKTYPIWATTNGVAKQISNSASTFGNDTIIFMAYPNAYNAMAPNWLFQEGLVKKINQALPEGQLELPTLEEWSGDNQTEVREKYFNNLSEALKKVKEGKGREGQSEWVLDQLAFEFGTENGINLIGKITGYAKFSHANYNLSKATGDRLNQIEQHPIYEAEIEGYNYQQLDEPIDFSYIKNETSGTDVAVQGKIIEMQGVKREHARKNNMYRQLQQRGITIAKGQAQLVDAIIIASEGDQTLLNQWLQDNPDSKGEIVDTDKYNEWYDKNLKVAEQLRSQANTSLNELLKPADNQQQQARDSKGRLPSHPDYEGGGINLYSDPFLTQTIWKALSVVGKTISRSAKGFTEWSKSMIDKIGDWIKPALRSLYAMTNQMPNTLKPATKKELAYEQAKSQPDPKLQEAQAKKDPELMGTLPSITEGYNMKLEHPALADNLVDVVEAMRTEFDIRRRGTISNEELLENAKRKAEKLQDKDIWNINQGDVFNAEDITSYRIYVTDKLLKVSDELKKLNKQSDPITIKQMSDELVNAMRMWQIVRAVGTELGRGVQSFNIPMDDNVIAGLKNLTKQINELDPDGKLGGDIIEEALDDLTKDKNEDGKKQSRWEFIRYVFLNWILQNPLTDVANIFGNSSNLGFHITANIGNLGGMSTLLRGLKNGVKEGSKNAVKIIHGEQEAISKFTEQSKIDIPASKERSWKNYLRLLVPTTRLGVEDAFFRALARNVEFERMTTKMSKTLSVNPDEIYNAVTSIINDPDIAKFTRKEYQDLADYLTKIEDELVFQKELGGVGKAFSKLSRYIFPILPFVTTPINIMKFGASATPFGALKLADKNLSPEERNQVIRRAIAGSTLMTGIATLISQGLMEITGGGSDDPFERDLMAKLGYKPYHLYINTPFGKFGGSYMNVNPLNTPLAVAGDLFDKYRFNKFKEENPADQKAWYDKVSSDMGTALLAFGSSITDQSYLSGVRDFMDALSGRNPDWFTRTLTGYARVGAIQGVQQITGTLDRGSYDTKGRASEQLQKNFPFTSNDSLIESVDAFGEQRQSQYERFPLPITSPKENTAYNWMQENGLKLKIPSKTTKLGNRELTRKEYEIYSKGVGQIMDKTIQKIWEQQTSEETEPDDKLDLEQLQDKLDATYDKAKKFMIAKIKKMIYEKYQLDERNK